MRRASPLERIHPSSRASLDVVAALDRSTLFLGHTLLDQRTPGTGLHPLVKQLYPVDVLLLAIVTVSGLFIGIVLALRGYNILISYDSEQAAEQMTALTLLHELGPVVIGLLFASRAGSAPTVEVGNMKAAEQLSDLEMIGIDPLKYIVVPHLWAGFISTPLLAAVFDVVGIWGGAMVVVDWLSIYGGSFWASMRNSVQFTKGMLNGVIKNIVFASMVTQIAVH